MNIQNIRGFLSHIDEIAVIGKKVEVDGVIGQVMGLVRYGTKVNLLILLYDEEFQKCEDRDDITGRYSISNRPESNRKMLLRQEQPQAKNPFQAVNRVFLGDKEYEISCIEYCSFNERDCEKVVLITEFLRKGWIPRGIDFQDIDMLFLTSLELEGLHSTLPIMNENLSLRFTMRTNSVNYLVEQPFTLNIDGEYKDKFWFQDALSGEEHWVQINNVYLSDMWADIDKLYDNPKIKEKMTLEQITEAKSNFEKQFLEVCPKGMCIPIIEYECEDNIFLQFYSKGYLAAVPEHRSSGVGFIVRPNQTLGLLGLKLKAAVIQEPMSPDTSSIAVELFWYSRVSTGDDILLE